MRISAKSEYACLAMLELAAVFPSTEPVRIKNIAKKHNIPARFLVQILLQLKGAGLVQSTRGASGGYRLILPPSAIRLTDIMDAVEGAREAPADTHADVTPAQNVLRALWIEAASAERAVLYSQTLDQVCKRVAEQGATGTYVI